MLTQLSSEMADAVAAAAPSVVQVHGRRRPASGLAYGNNVGIRPAFESDAPPDYFLLLNPDTVALPGCLEKLIRFMDSTPSAGLAGPRIESGGGVVQH